MCLKLCLFLYLTGQYELNFSRNIFRDELTVEWRTHHRHKFHNLLFAPKIYRLIKLWWPIYLAQLEETKRRKILDSSPKMMGIPWRTRLRKLISLNNGLRVNELDLKSSQDYVDSKGYGSQVSIKSRNFETNLMVVWSKVLPWRLFTWNNLFQWYETWTAYSD